tara:strand:- start:457 stop:1125 length:669 start_codon:yes stop_codon:yes gene_type:complete
MSIKEKYIVKSIKFFECKEWLLYKHYAKRIPSISYAFGLYKNNILIGICTYGVPISKELCDNLLGIEYRKKIYELNRLCVNEGLPKNVLSYFLSNTFKMLPKPLALVSYADTSQGHNGYIYQATNWIYTGLSVANIDWKLKGTNRHSRTLGGQYNAEYMKAHPEMFEKVKRSRKHRYIMLLGNKKQKKIMKKRLSYKIENYPKGKNKRYDSSYKPSTQTILF